MKKRVLSALTALVLALSLLPVSAFAVGAFSDIADADTARDVEVLRLLGVLNGKGDGLFHPNDSLTRAEFCKMAVELMGCGDEIARYKTRTIFPDVRASHWAVAYINFAAAKENSRWFINGQPDGNFAPDREITYGEAVTILMRLMGYTDAQAGAIWPDGYVNLAREKSVSDGLSLAGSSRITRAQAAKLFVNTLSAKTAAGTEYLTTRGTAAAEATLLSVNGATGTLRTSAASYEMARPMASSALDGVKGRVLLDANGKALTFVPTKSKTGGSAVVEGAVIVNANGSTAGIEAITGGASDYSIVKNGAKIARSELKVYDVLTYSAATNTLYACDTRVVAYYESCTPSPAAPETIRTLGGTTFTVVSSAQQSLAQFKPGRVLVLLLTADGRVAGAVENGTGAMGNAFGFVDAAGKLSLICGGALLPVAASGAGYEGSVVRVSQTSRDEVTLTRQTGGATEALDVKAKKLGSRTLAENVMIFDYGAQIALSDLTGERVGADQISYYRTDGANRVDLLVLRTGAASSVVYGRAIVTDGIKSGVFGDVEVTYLQIEYGEGKTTAAIETAAAAADGSYVEAVLGEGRYLSVTALTKYEAVPASAWIGSGAVNAGGTTCTVPEGVACYNADARSWMSDLAAARAYADTATLYVKDGVVRIVEVGG